MRYENEEIAIKWFMYFILTILLIPLTILLYDLSIKSNIRMVVDKNQPSYSQLERYQKQYVTTKKVPIKYIEYSKEEEFFMFWTQKRTYIKVFYPKNLKNIPKTETFNKLDISETYKIADKKHKSGTKELIFSYQTYDKNTPKSIKTKLEENQKNIFENFGPDEPDVNNIEFTIYQNAKK